MKESQINYENQTPDANVDDGHGDNVEEIEETTVPDEQNDANTDNEGNEQPDDEGSDANTDDEGNDANIGVEDNDATVCDDTNSSSHPDIFYPRYWDGLDPKMIDILVQKGPKRYLSIKHGPIDKKTRRFSASAYTRALLNGETCGR
jgi:hypothetical protein